ncbi:unnamed protein product [Meloidogyne enterolobii]|uniref:Uncharacterized protein n=1 Tax=Meloidogyne enterolobii TaxID=390850 RepID=A0ACB1AR61_MELEN
MDFRGLSKRIWRVLGRSLQKFQKDLKGFGFPAIPNCFPFVLSAFPNCFPFDMPTQYKMFPLLPQFRWGVRGFLCFCFPKFQIVSLLILPLVKNPELFPL